MREILFKGKKLDSGEWAEGHYFANENGTFIFAFPFHANYAGLDVMVKVEPNTICQYTGPTDKNGKKIFEGDIVRTKFYGKDSGTGCNFADYDIFAITYSCGAFHTENKNRRFLIREDAKLEVIGNIFDNSDLLTTSSTDSD